MARLVHLRLPFSRLLTPSLLLFLALQAGAATAPSRGEAAEAWQNQSLPIGLSSSTATYDPVRDRMVVFGGYHNYYSNGVAELLLGGSAWSPLLPTGFTPEWRIGHTAIYDPDNDRIVIYGGYRPAIPMNGSWYLSDCPTIKLSGTPQWGGLASGPVRAFHSAIHDPKRKQMVIFGGVTSNQVWALPLVGPATWTQITPSGTLPSGRNYHSAIYDPVRDRMIVFGGDDGAVRNDVWALSFSGTPTWTQLTPDGTPPAPRSGHTAVYDSYNDRMIVFGGGTATPFNDTWALSLAGTPAWTQIATTGATPTARRSHVAVYDAARHRLVAFGGSTATGTANDTNILPLVGSPEWATLTGQGIAPGARYGHSAVYSALGNRMIVFGGYSNGRLNDVGSLSLTNAAPSWVPITPTGSAPAVRQLHAAAYDAIHQRMLVFGGNGNGGNANDTWTLSLVGTPGWSELLPIGTPPAGRQGHSMIFDPVRDRFIVFGGYSSTHLNDTWELTLPGTPSWTQLAPTGTPPSGRMLHSAIYDPVRDRMLVFGGTGASSNNEVWELTLGVTPAWTQLTPSGTAPAARNGQSAIYDPVRDRMVVFGGVSTGVNNDVYALSLSGSPAWSQLFATGPLPVGRYQSSGVYDPGLDRMMVFGGFGSGALGDLWSLFLATPFTVTASAGAGGGINPSGFVPAAQGMSLSFTITPTPGFKIADVLEDGVSVGAVPAHSIVNVQANHTIAASFAVQPPDTITATAGSGGSITPSGSVVVAPGTNQAFTIAATAGNHIAEVQVDGVTIGPASSFTFVNIASNHTITASFLQNSFSDLAAGLPAITGRVASWADYDNDADLDVLLMGGETSAPTTQLYRNNGATFTLVATPIPGLYGASAAWGDYDRDGDLDLLVAGYTGGSPVVITRVYRRDPGGFVDINAGMQGLYIGAVAWVDYDNDGDLDAYAAGNGSGAICRNDGGTFVSGPAPAFYYGIAEWGDYDNDGDLDLLASGNFNQVLPQYFGALYRNDGGTLTPTSVSVPAAAGALAWGDYDRDGNLDFAVSASHAMTIHRNNGDGSFSNINAGLPSVSTSVVKWSDYDNDGDLDLFAGAGSPDENPRIYRNDAGAFHDAMVGLPGYASSAGGWGDYDNNGRADLLLMGGLSYPPTVYATRIYTNLLAPLNTLPTAPAGLATSFNGQFVTLSWNAASDTQTPAPGLSYNVRVGTTPGGIQVVSPMSAANGYRRLPQLGNAGQRLSYTFKVPAVTQTYYWSVQAVDGALAGGPFAGEQQFSRVLDAPSGLPRELSFALTGPNPGAGSVQFRLGLPAVAHARLAIFDLAGREVARLVDRDLPAGYHPVTWRRGGATGGSAAGVYYARLVIGPRVMIQKFVALE